MRISDWSSDVCSSDLQTEDAGKGSNETFFKKLCRGRVAARENSRCCSQIVRFEGLLCDDNGGIGGRSIGQRRPDISTLYRQGRRHPRNSRRKCARSPRSEEHTSELQSLMRISYAVFCLKKNKNHYKKS